MKVKLLAILTIFLPSVCFANVYDDIAKQLKIHSNFLVCWDDGLCNDLAPQLATDTVFEKKVGDNFTEYPSAECDEGMKKIRHCIVDVVNGDKTNSYYLVCNHKMCDILGEENSCRVPERNNS